METFLFISECNKADVDLPDIDYIREKVYDINKNLNKTKSIYFI